MLDAVGRQEWRQLLFVSCFLHSIVQVRGGGISERRGRGGWGARGGGADRRRAARMLLCRCRLWPHLQWAQAAFIGRAA